MSRPMLILRNIKKVRIFSNFAVFFFNETLFAIFVMQNIDQFAQ